jgi:hypothetical protein
MVDGDDDADRAAILARRQRFIALAISGMAAGCGDDSSNSSTAMPCLDVAPQTDSVSTTATTATDSMSGPVDTTAETSGGTTGMPMPCLDVAPDSSTGTTDGTSSGDGSTSTTTGGESSSGAPMPCLVPPGG